MISNIFEEQFVIEGDVNYKLSGDTLDIKANSNFVFWFKKEFKQMHKIEYLFCPKSSEGLAMIFFGANGIDGQDLFSPQLKKRDGDYPQYHSSDIECYHASYYRRKWDIEREFHLANLRKSPGFNLVAQGPDPIPTISASNEKYYKVEIIFSKYNLSFKLEGVEIYSFPIEEVISGYIGLRQMSPLTASYKDFKVHYA